MLRRTSAAFLVFSVWCLAAAGDEELQYHVDIKIYRVLEGIVTSGADSAVMLEDVTMRRLSLPEAEQVQRRKDDTPVKTLVDPNPGRPGGRYPRCPPARGPSAGRPGTRPLVRRG